MITILTQNKEGIWDCSKFYITKTEEKYGIVERLPGEERVVMLGEYATEERAKEVLMEIWSVMIACFESNLKVFYELPEENLASVLIYTQDGGVSEGQYYSTIKSWKQFRWSVENAEVTHWMPLPEPPKGET